MLIRFAKTLRGHMFGPLNYYDHHISTGPSERTNNKIKTLQKQAYGFRDMSFFKLKIVLGLSRLPNIKLYHRIRSRQLKLWGTDKKKTHKNIGAAIAGQIRPEIIDKGWRDILWILASIEAGTAKPAIILNHLLVQPHHPAAQGLVELGKLEQSSYALHYGMDMDLRRFVVPFTSRREHWNKFARKVQAFGDLIREKTLEDQEEVSGS